MTLAVVGDESYDAAALEEQRVGRAVTGSNVRALNAGHQPRAPKAKVCSPSDLRVATCAWLSVRLLLSISDQGFLLSEVYLLF